MATSQRFSYLNFLAMQGVLMPRKFLDERNRQTSLRPTFLTFFIAFLPEFSGLENYCFSMGLHLPPGVVNTFSSNPSASRYGGTSFPTWFAMILWLPILIPHFSPKNVKKKRFFTFLGEKYGCPGRSWHGKMPGNCVPSFMERQIRVKHVIE